MHVTRDVSGVLIHPHRVGDGSQCEPLIVTVRPAEFRVWGQGLHTSWQSDPDTDCVSSGPVTLNRGHTVSVVLGLSAVLDATCSQEEELWCSSAANRKAVQFFPRLQHCAYCTCWPLSHVGVLHVLGCS